MSALRDRPSLPGPHDHEIAEVSQRHIAVWLRLLPKEAPNNYIALGPWDTRTISHGLYAIPRQCDLDPIPAMRNTFGPALTIPKVICFSPPAAEYARGRPREVSGEPRFHIRSLVQTLASSGSVHRRSVALR